MIVLRWHRPKPLLSRAEVDGLLVMLMRIDANIELIAQAAEEDEDGEPP